MIFHGIFRSKLAVYGLNGSPLADLTRYWHQRHEIFSKYDDGIWMTDDAWFGVTPEPVAAEIAAHISTVSPTITTIVDAFAGVGGNTIAFALSGRWERIFAIEKDPQVLACAKHNAEIYGVANKIWWIQGDCFDVLKKRLARVVKEAVIFGSPPWGGPGYRDAAVFNLSTMQPYTLKALYEPFSKLSKTVVLFLPRTSDLNQLAKYAPEDKDLCVMHYCMHGASKALVAYFGEFVFD
ncbi:putative diacylglycerol O-acyltransferase tgs1 [Elasticomyces elasticus]|nr:putative diacylglycerol O-acyltransferase tgs1 [Elasticomyces elasticus]